MKPIIFVCGLARCGTSLMMQMLYRAGIPCAGDWPAFEPPAISPISSILDEGWLRAHVGHAIKLIDPFRFSIPENIPYLVIWLDRNELEQARSQAKFVHLIGGFPMANRAHIRRIAGALVEQRKLSLKKLAGWPRLFVRFEDLIKPSSRTPEALAKFLAAQFGTLDQSEMARAIIPRPSKCQPGIDIEIGLIERGRSVA